MEFDFSDIVIKTGDTREYYIYGTAQKGYALKKILTELFHITVKGYVVSTGYRPAGIKEIRNTPLYEVQELPTIMDKDNSVICVTSQQGEKDILALLEKYNLSDISFYTNSTDDMIRMYAFFYRKYFNDKGIDTEGDILKIGQYRFVSPFHSNVDYAFPFFEECGDLIIPTLFNDKSCIWEGAYEYGPVTFVDNENVKIAIDCGANLGLFSSIAAHTADKVYAFEPIDTTAEYMLANTEMNGNVERVSAALGNHSGKVSFRTDIHNNSANSIAADGKGDTTVALTSIDEFVESNHVEGVDFIKADIEGAERHMLEGAMNTLRRFHPQLALCEYHLPDDPEVLEGLIKKADPNYVVMHHYSKIFAYVPEK